MAKFFFALLTATATITSVSAAAVPEAKPVPAPFAYPVDTPIVDLRSEAEKAASPIKRSALSKRVNGGVYVCKAINFDASQGCALLVLGYNQDTSLIGTEWNNVISSAGADPNNDCWFYDAYSGGCTGQGNLYIGNPGLSDFTKQSWAGDSRISWNDITTCIRCTWR